MPLSASPRIFDLDRNHFQKGFFPHLFDTRKNADYEGPMPPRDQYVLETMSAADKQPFHRCYDTQVANNITFNLRCDLKVYCVSDVRFLHKGCLTFSEDFKNPTKSCPFSTMTIAEACSHDF